MQLPCKFSNSKRFSFSKCGGSPPKGKRHSEGEEKDARHSLVVRSISSFQLEALAKSSREKRRSSSPTHEVMEVVAAIRAEAEHQEVAAKAISSASLEEALKKIQALKDDVELASHHSQQSSSPGMSAEPSQVEICLTEPTSHPSEAVSVQVSA